MGYGRILPTRQSSASLCFSSLPAVAAFLAFAFRFFSFSFCLFRFSCGPSASPSLPEEMCIISMCPVSPSPSTESPLDSCPCFSRGAAGDGAKGEAGDAPLGRGDGRAGYAGVVRTDEGRTAGTGSVERVEGEKAEGGVTEDGTRETEAGTGEEVEGEAADGREGGCVRGGDEEEEGAMSTSCTRGDEGRGGVRTRDDCCTWVSLEGGRVGRDGGGTASGVMGVKVRMV